MNRLEGKVALITGGARGQGEAEARLFVEEGARVVLTDILDTEGKAVAESIGNAALYCHHDVRLEEDWLEVIEAATAAFGRIDVLVNNAGILKFSPLVDTALEDYMQVVEVNQVSCFLGMKTVAKTMKAAGGGSIINVSSAAGLTGTPHLVSYTASKFAVRGMTKVAAIEFGRWGIRVNSIHPGGVATPMIGLVPNQELVESDQEGLFNTIPLGRVGIPDEMAKLALFLASDDSSYCTGSEFTADGGLLAGTNTQPPPDKFFEK